MLLYEGSGGEEIVWYVVYNPWQLAPSIRVRFQREKRLSTFKRETTR